jgi:hypothetical protein
VSQNHIKERFDDTLSCKESNKYVVGINWNNITHFPTENRISLARNEQNSTESLEEWQKEKKKIRGCTTPGILLSKHITKIPAISES